MSPHGITERDLAILIPRFHDRVRNDAQLGPVFASAITDWPVHLAKLVDFWSSVMLARGRYRGQPVPAHLRHADVMRPIMFTRWLAIWHDVTGETLAASKVEALQLKAARIAESLQLAIRFHPGSPMMPGPNPCGRRLQ